MAKKTTAKTAAKPKVTEEQVQRASEMVRGEPGKEAPTPQKGKAPFGEETIKKSATPSPKKTKPVPDFLKDDVQSYVVGTEDYRKLVEDFNKRNATAYNPWRVRPQILYVIWKEQRAYYGVK